MPHNRPPSNPNYSYSQIPQAGLNRSYNKTNTNNYNFPPARNNLSRSKVSLASSQASHLTNLVNEPDVFPE
jgi:hypothetical protein